MKLVAPVPQPTGPRAAASIPPAAKTAIWMFYHSNPDRVLLKVGGFIKIRVRDLRILFEALAGPEGS